MPITSGTVVAIDRRTKEDPGFGVRQIVIAKLEAGKTRNIGLQTLGRAVKAMNGRIEVSIIPVGARGGPGANGPREDTGLRQGKSHEIVQGEPVYAVSARHRSRTAATRDEPQFAASADPRRWPVRAF